MVMGEDPNTPDKPKPLTYAEWVSWHTLLRSNIMDACENQGLKADSSGILISDIKFNEPKGYVLVQCGNQLTLTWLMGNMTQLTPVPKVVCKRIDLAESYTLRLWVPRTYLAQPINELLRELKNFNGDRFKNVHHLTSVRDGKNYAYTDIELSRPEAKNMWGNDAPFRLWGASGLITAAKGKEPASLPHDTAIAYRNLLKQYKDLTGKDPEDLQTTTEVKHFDWDALIADPAMEDDPEIVDLRTALTNALPDWKRQLEPSFRSFNDISLPTVKKLIRDATERDRGLLASSGNLKRPRFADEEDPPIDVEERLKAIKNAPSSDRMRAEMISTLIRDKLSQDRSLTLKKYSSEHPHGQGGRRGGTHGKKTSDPSKVKSSARAGTSTRSRSKTPPPAKSGSPTPTGSPKGSEGNKSPPKQTTPPPTGERTPTPPPAGEQSKSPPASTQGQKPDSQTAAQPTDSSAQMDTEETPQTSADPPAQAADPTQRTPPPPLQEEEMEDDDNDDIFLSGYSSQAQTNSPKADQTGK